MIRGEWVFGPDGSTKWSTSAQVNEKYTTEDYRKAIGADGEGPMGSPAYDWADKPHRLVYDLCTVVGCGWFDGLGLSPGW
jgi:hypothetical protein